MKKQELIKVIELIVRKEVKKQVNEIFIKENNKTQEPSLTELVSEPINEVETKPKKEVHYTDNQELNKVLNETAGGIPQGDSEYPTMGGSVFDKSRMTELMGYGQSDEVKRDKVAVDTIKKAGKTVQDVPEHVTNALTKDYSKLMKALDKKKQGGLG